MRASLSSEYVGTLGPIPGLGTLTDYERAGLSAALNLADGHAAQETEEDFGDLIQNLPATWKGSDVATILESEEEFRHAFASLAASETMKTSSHYVVCPSASVSIDIAGAVLAALGRNVSLVEPTFDNIALLLQRRGVQLRPLDERQAFSDDRANVAGLGTGAVFLVQPNNPTGGCLSADQLRSVAKSCRDANAILVLDNSFRFYNRAPFDDYAVLTDVGVSYLALEDTGKVWPTHDLKASLLFCSRDLADLTRAVYGELFLSCSAFGLRVLESFVRRTSERGLRRVLWDVVDTRRAALREALAGTSLRCDDTTKNSTMPVEWLDCSATGMTDVELVRLVAANGVRLLPGRQFFWHSGVEQRHHFRARAAMMKPANRFARSLAVLSSIGDLLSDLRA